MTMRMTIATPLIAAAVLTLAACSGDAATADGDADVTAAAETAGAGESDGDGDGSGQAALDFGNDTDEYANDGECDDPRFQGSNMADVLLTTSIGKDAADCQAAFEAGENELNPLFVTPASNADIDYGTNTSRYADDNECDDVRFTGDYAATMAFISEDIGTDANDCRAAVESGDARWQGATATPALGITQQMIDQATP